MTQEFKQWVGVGAILLLMGAFISRMNQTNLPDDPILLATLQILEVIETNVAQSVPTATYTLAFVEGGGGALAPIATNVPALPLPTAIPIAIATATNAPTATIVPTMTSVPTDTNILLVTNVPTETPPVILTEAIAPTIGIVDTVTAEAPSANMAQASVVDVPTAMAIPQDAVVRIVATTHPELLPPVTTMNGLALTSFIIMDEATQAHVRRIFTQGQAMGRNARAFTRIGDSTIEAPHFLTRFDGGSYHLGDYGYLQGVIDYYAGSFGHGSVAIRRGLHTWSVFDPLWADNRLCASNEHLLACELRRSNPSILIVRLGSNDAGVPASTERNLRRLIEYCLERGVIPIMGTKADRFEGSDTNNAIIRRLAQEYRVPLWDFDVVAGTVAGRGLGGDGVHLTTFFAHDWRLPEAWRRGHAVHNLSALMMLDAIWRVLKGQDLP